MGVRQPGNSNLLLSHMLGNRENPGILKGYKIHAAAERPPAPAAEGHCQRARDNFIRLGIREL